MRNLVDIGKDEVLYVDADLVVIILPDEQKGFGSLVITDGAPAPLRTSLAQVEVYQRLAGAS